MLRHQRERKRAKLLQYAQRVWNLATDDENARIDLAIEKTEQFFRALGVGVTFADYGISHDAIDAAASRLTDRGMTFGEHGDLTGDDARKILTYRA